MRTSRAVPFVVAASLVSCTGLLPYYSSRPQVISEARPSHGPPGMAPPAVKRVVRKNGGVAPLALGLLLDGTALFILAVLLSCPPDECE